MAKITRIKASDPPREREEDDEPKVVHRQKIAASGGRPAETEVAKKAKQIGETGAEKQATEVKTVKQVAEAELVEKDPEQMTESTEKEEKAEKRAKKADRKAAEEAEGKKPFVLFRPFVALGCYIRDSWKEIRQVRWPTRKATWKMVLAVLVYTALLMALISLLDMFFTWLFNLIIQ